MRRESVKHGPASFGLLGSLSRFGCARDGVSAVEFALILPFMLTLYLGGAELGDGMAVQFKATLAARTVADLASQCGISSLDGQHCDSANGLPIDSTTMGEIVGSASVQGAAETVMSPYPTNNMVATVSELKFTGGNGTATVIWSASNSGSARSTGSSYALPSAFQSLPAGTYYVILGEVTYPYTPSMGYAITGTINIYENTLFFPRMATCIQYNGVPSAC